LRFSSGWTDLRPTDSMQELLRRADVALYEDKRAGKNKSKTETVITPVAAPQSAV
jgi:PleD family two-component response regulator